MEILGGTCSARRARSDEGKRNLKFSKNLMFFVLNNPGLGTNDDGLCTVFEAGSAGGTRPRLG